MSENSRLDDYLSTLPAEWEGMREYLSNGFREIAASMPGHELCLKIQRVQDDLRVIYHDSGYNPDAETNQQPRLVLDMTFPKPQVPYVQ